MPQKKRTILESWPAIREDLGSFLADTDAWIIDELKKAHQAGDREAIAKVIEVMEFVHALNHSH